MNSVVSTDSLLIAQQTTRDVKFEDSLVEYLLNIVEATREHEGFQVGVSTRGALSYYRGCQARAVTESRDYVTPDDIKVLAVPCLAHRVLPRGIFQGANRSEVEAELSDVIQQISVPV